MSECIYTGCSLYIPAENKSLWGDLHVTKNRDGEWVALVFNGVVNEDILQYNQPRWEYNTDSRKTHPTVSCLDRAYFERRGVVVFSEYTFNAPMLQRFSDGTY